MRYYSEADWLTLARSGLDHDLLGSLGRGCIAAWRLGGGSRVRVDHVVLHGEHLVVEEGSVVLVDRLLGILWSLEGDGG